MDSCWLFCTLLLTTLPFSESVNVLSDYFLSAGIGGHCGETISSKKSVFIKSHIGAGMLGGLTSYSANTDCQVTFIAGSGKKVLVQFPFFDLPVPIGDTCSDWIHFSGDQTTTTVTAQDSQVFTTDATAGTSTIITTEPPTTELLNTGQTTDTVLTNSPPKPGATDKICVKPASYTSSSNQVTVRFVSNGSTQKKGFSLLITSFHEGPCTDSDFQCDTNRCIPSTLTCDGIEHCIDGSDESKDKVSLVMSAALQTNSFEQTLWTETWEQGLYWQTRAECSILDEAIGAVTSLGSLAVLGIGIVVVVIIFTIVTVIILWKYIKGDATCKSTVGVDESDIPVVKVTKTDGKGQDTKPVKHKKSVTIGESRDNPTPVDPVNTKKDKVKGKLNNSPSDVAW